MKPPFLPVVLNGNCPGDQEIGDLKAESACRGVLGIVTALESERRWIADPPANVIVELSGMGAGRAERAASRLVNEGSASALVSWGCAGALDADLRAGTILLPDSIIDPADGEIRCHRGWRDRLLARLEGQLVVSLRPLLHATAVVDSPALKKDLRRRFDAGAVDMESVAVARVAEASHVPFIAIRVVLDGAGVRLPRAVLDSTNSQGRLCLGAVLRRAVLSPGDWPAFFGLAGAHWAAGRSMRRLWALEGPDLGAFWGPNCVAAQPA